MFGKYRKLYEEQREKTKGAQQLADMYEAENYNLNLYLYWLEKNFADIYEDMVTYFKGMPAYAGNKLITEDLPEDFFCNC